MRKASIGIAAAVLLTTLAIVVVPAFAPVVPTKFLDSQGDVLRINAIVPGSFELNSGRLGGELCDGVGARVTNGFLWIAGRCTYQGSETLYAGKGVLAGGGKLTGPIILTLTVAGKPLTVMKFIMMPYTPSP
jgi:hypothetical protein